MSTLRIPVRTDLPAYSMTVQLEGAPYDLRFRYNARDAHWFMDVLQAEQLVLAGVKVVHDADLLGQFDHMKADERLPPGAFEVRDVTGADRDPDRTTFGSDVLLLYVESV